MTNTQERGKLGGEQQMSQWNEIVKFCWACKAVLYCNSTKCPKCGIWVTHERR